MEVKCLVCGVVKRYPPSWAKNKKYCSIKCRLKVLPMPKTNVPIGSKHKIASGYVEIKTPNGWMLEHIYVAEQSLGRKINRRKEMVHHVNHIKNDNRPENLLVLSRGEHIWLHRKLNLLKSK
jgi:hypothetical protein